VEDTQPCLLVTGEAESGKKTLLYSFLKQSKELHPNWVFVTHFGSVTPIYYNILFKTMIELRVPLPPCRITSTSSRRWTSTRKNSEGTSNTGWK
jgi:hypothetical protein